MRLKPLVHEKWFLLRTSINLEGGEVEDDIIVKLGKHISTGSIVRIGGKSEKIFSGSDSNSTIVGYKL